jgi:hypothetical protein
MGSDQPAPETAGSALERLVLLARSHPGLALGTVVCVAAVAYATATWLWESDRSQVVGVVKSVAAGMESGSPQDVLAHVSPYFSEEGVSKWLLERNLKSSLRRRPISRLNVSIRQVDVGRSDAALTAHVVSYHGRRLSTRFARSEWYVVLEKIEGRWLVRRARPLEVNGHPVAGLRAVLALGY